MYNLDTLRTASNSSATVYLEDKTQIALGEDTLLVLDLAGESKRLDLSGGTLRIKREASSGELKVAMKGGELKLDTGAALLSDTKGGVAVAVTEGQASFQGAGGTTIALDSSRAATAAVALDEAGNVTALPLEPIAPANGKELVTLDPRGTVDFSWIGPASFKGKIILATDSELRVGRMAIVVSGGDADGSGADVRLAPGTYWWRLEGSGKGSPEPSKIMHFTLAPSFAPRIVRPAASASLSSGRGKSSLVDLAWSPSPRAAAYRVEAASDPGFEKPEISLRCEGTSISTDKLGLGAWYWRVTALYPASGLEAASPTSTFTIAKIERAKPLWRGQDPSYAVSTLALRKGRLEPLLGTRGGRPVLRRHDSQRFEPPRHRLDGGGENELPRRRGGPLRGKLLRRPPREGGRRARPPPRIRVP